MKKSIRSKIMLCVMLVVGFAFLASAIGGTEYFLRVLEQHIVLEEEQKQEQAAKQIAYIQNNIMSLAKQIVVDDEIQDCMKMQRDEEIIDRLIKASSIKETLRRYINQQSFIHGVTILLENGVSFSSNNTEDAGAFVQEEWYQNFRESGRKEGFSDTHMYTVEQGLTKAEVVSYIMEFKSLDNKQDTIGEIMIHISCPYLKKYVQMDSVLLTGYAMYDAYGNAISESGDISVPYEKIKELLAGKSLSDSGDTLLIHRNMKDNWVLVSEVSKQLLINQLRFVKVFFMSVFGSAAAVLVCILFVVIKNITKPVEQLHKAALLVGEGNLDVSVDIQTNDELSVLGDAFNTMIADIQKMLKESVEYEKTTKEMEINRLMLQINPHFIYNTLNSIVYMARIGGNEDIVRFSNAFISLLQDTLRVKKDSIYTTMDQELKNIKNYLLLQAYRYPNRFDVFYEIDENVLDTQIPNVFLQPIVENAVFHGLAAKMDKGHLWIRVCRNMQNVEITIEDDGVGMSVETLEEIMRAEDPVKGEMRTIGVGNVIQRIRHIYGDEYRLDIESAPGKGTKVNIIIPYKKSKEEEGK